MRTAVVTTLGFEEGGVEEGDGEDENAAARVDTADVECTGLGCRRGDGEEVGVGARRDAAAAARALAFAMADDASSLTDAGCEVVELGDDCTCNGATEG